MRHLKSHINNSDIGDYISNNELLELYDKHDLDSVSIIKGVEAFLVSYTPLKYVDNYNGQKYSNQLYEAFINDPYNYFDSFLLEEEYSKRFFPFFKNLKISRIMRKVKNRIQNILDNGPKDLNERHLLMKYLKDNIDLDDEKQKNFILEIIDKGVVPEDYEELAFLCNYVGKWVLRETKNDDIDLIGIPANFDGIDESGGYALENVFFINSQNNNLFDFLRAICHETQHIIQKEKSHRLSASSIEHEDSFAGFVDYENEIFDVFFRRDKKENYFFSRNEYDAEVNGIKYTYNFLSFLGKKDLANDFFDRRRFNNPYETGRLYKLYLEPICSNGKYKIEKEFAEYASVSMWDEIIKYNSHLVESYPIFQKFYDLKGNQLPFEVMINNDLSEGDNLNYYYDYIFNYIQCGALDNYDLSNNDIVIKNLYLIYNQVLYRVRNLVNFGTNKMNDINYQFAESGITFSADEIKEIFNAEIIYYFSFLTKITKYLYNNLNITDRLLKANFDSNIESIFQLFESILTNNSRYGEIEGLDGEKVKLFLDENRSDLKPIYDDIILKKIQRFYNRRFEEVVPINYRKIVVDFNNKKYTLDDLVNNVLPHYASSKDVNKIKINDDDFEFNEFILVTISKCTNNDEHLNDILILFELMKANYVDYEEFRNNMVDMFNRIIINYKEKDIDYYEFLKNAYDDVERYYQENKFSHTPIDLEFQVFSDEVKDVISRSRN
ncbi:MAG: hypothetical protein IKJ43_00615 [Bacilli bacterium]|nr:hypothetical protein [Bacilli bacterium]